MSTNVVDCMAIEFQTIGWAWFKIPLSKLLGPLATRVRSAAVETMKKTFHRDANVDPFTQTAFPWYSYSSKSQKARHAKFERYKVAEKDFN